MKTVLITGASSGFGYTTSLLLARKGYTVYSGVRNLKKTESLELQTIAGQEHLRLYLVQLDVTKQADVDNLNTVIQKVDVLINNAGIGYLGTAEEFTVDEMKDQFETNFFGVVRMIKAVLPYMRNRKSGLIINLSSISGLVSFPLYGVYSASKYALETYSEALRFEIRPFGINVVLIEPGSFLTNFIKNKYFPKAQSNRLSPYFSFTLSFFKIFSSFDKLKNSKLLARFFSPERVGKRITKIIETEKPRFHNVIGIDAHLFLTLNHLPSGLKTFFLRKMYKW